MSLRSAKIILGSRSPRRLELLRLLVPAASIRVLPPQSPAEPGFDHLHDWSRIEQRLRDVARSKCDDVLAQLAADQPPGRSERETAVVTADTIIVASEADGRLIVLGQPPEDRSWREVVRDWFYRYYFGHSHVVATAFCVAAPAGRVVERVVTSRVTFHPEDPQSEALLDWYIGTGEPRGKAGGYALQGAGGVFVSGVEGSLSNVVGLPLRELWEALHEIGADVAAIRH